jgi:hypothetical protein
MFHGKPIRETNPTSRGVPVKKYLPYVIAFGAGVILANRVRTLPGLNRLPSV